jgi:hypothetical protein
MICTATTRRISGIVSVALALSVAAPAGARPLGPDNQGSYSQVPVTRPELVSQVGSVRSGNPAVRPNPDEQTAAPTTTGGGPSSEVIDNGGYGPAVAPPAVIRVATPSGGFDWGDAGIGAAATIGVVLLGVAGAFALSQRRARRSGRSTALIG